MVSPLKEFFLIVALDFYDKASIQKQKYHQNGKKNATWVKKMLPPFVCTTEDYNGRDQRMQEIKDADMISNFVEHLFLDRKNPASMQYQ